MKTEKSDFALEVIPSPFFVWWVSYGREVQVKLNIQSRRETATTHKNQLDFNLQQRF